MRYVWRDGEWRDRDGNVMAPSGRTEIRAPMVVSDLPAYMSPLGTGMIDGRKARREDLKRNNCREVDPGEFRPAFYNKKFADKRGLPLAEGQAPSKPWNVKIDPVIR